MSRVRCSTLIVCCALSASACLAFEPGDPLPTLDELLGLDRHGQVIEQVIVDANDAALDQVLDPKQAGKAFSRAVNMMDQVSQRISQHNDLSLPTQRLQEDILTMLDQVIESANKNNSNASSSSPSSSQQSSNQQQPDQQQQGQQPGEGGDPSNQPGDSSMPAGGSDAQPGDTIAPNGVRWGSLPERIREALSQGIADQYSELYRAITEQYYKSLAEDE